MRGLLSRLFARLRRRPPADPAVPAETSVDHVAGSMRAARALSAALDRAMASGRWARAARIAATADRLAPFAPDLTERLVRLHLVHRRPEVALSLIAACRRTTPSLETLRAVSHLALGQTDRAHAVLLKIARGERASAEVRRMLALIEWDQGDTHAATMELLRNLKYGEDARTLELLMLVAVSQERHEQAGVWARRLQQTCALTEDPTWGALVRCSLQLDDARPRAVVRQEDVNRLGAALMAREQVIPALVAAQRVRPTRHVIDALAAAIEHVLPRLADEAAALEALTHLCILAGERDRAYRWTRRYFERCTPTDQMRRLRHRLEQLRTTGTSTRDVVGRIGFNDAPANDVKERAA